MTDLVTTRTGQVLGCRHTGGWGLCVECEAHSLRELERRFDKEDAT